MQQATHDWYYNLIKKYLVLGKPQERYLVRRAKEGDLESRNRLIECNLRLAMSIACRYSRVPRIPLEDLVQESTIGLFHAIKTFDFSKGTSFVTLAVWWMRQRITRYITANRHIVPMPQYMEEFRSKYGAMKKEFIDELGRLPTVEEAAMILETTQSTIDYLEKGITEVYLDAPVEDDDGNTSLKDLLAVTEPDVLFNDERLDAMIDVLNGQERFVLQARLEGKTLRAIGYTMDISREMVRQIENKIMRKLRAKALTMHKSKPRELLTPFEMAIGEDGRRKLRAVEQALKGGEDEHERH